MVNYTGLTYKKGATTLGTLTYSYDLAGRRISQDGTYARTGLPAAMTGTVFDANNRLTTQGATTFSYDLNGNLTNDGTTTYTWNARDQLTAISGAVTASFQYDAVGRRHGEDHRRHDDQVLLRRHQRHSRTQRQQYRDGKHIDRSGHR